MSRNSFSRGVLNEADILHYLLARYNVTLRVTTFEEPLLVVMDTLSRTDVLFGMHGAGWTNGLFIKHGATTMQVAEWVGLVGRRGSSEGRGRGGEGGSH
jgi:hypothetical protein